MDEARARAVIAAAAERVPGGFILWRGPGLGGNDVDIVALAGYEAELAAALSDHGLKAKLRRAGRAMWTFGEAVRLDVLPASAWPRRYPPLDGVALRARPGSADALVASAADRLLVLAADAVAGGPIAKLAHRAEGALGEPGAREALERLAAELGAQGLADLISDPDRLRALAIRGRLPWGIAGRYATGSGLARNALVERLADASAARMPGIGPGGSGRGLLVALCGMDGSGKSTAARVAGERLDAAGYPASIAWARLGQEGRLQDAIARPVKRVLGTHGTVADPLAATIGADRERVTGAGVQRREGVVAWVWTLIVAAINARAHRRAVRRLRTGESVVCDRWLADSLVDLRIRYGRHPAAEWLLRLLVPKPDLGLLLAIDAATSTARKPDDQAPEVVARMEDLYADAAKRSGLVTVDARRPLADVSADVAELVDRLVAGAHLRR